MPILTVRVIDVTTGSGVSGAGVYLFIEGGSIEPPVNADISGTTGSDGVAQFDVEGFFRVGIIAKGYESAYDPHTPPEEWKDVWTCWGAVGVARDITYDFPVKYVGLPPSRIPIWLILPFGVGLGAIYLAGK